MYYVERREVSVRSSNFNVVMVIVVVSVRSVEYIIVKKCYVFMVEDIILVGVAYEGRMNRWREN